MQGVMECETYFAFHDMPSLTFLLLGDVHAGHNAATKLRQNGETAHAVRGKSMSAQLSVPS